MDFMIYFDQDKSLYFPITNEDGSLHLCEGIDESEEFVREWLGKQDTPENYEVSIIPTDAGDEYWEDDDEDGEPNPLHLN